MPQWGAFLAVVAVLTGLLLLLSRQSQRFIRAAAEGESTGPENRPVERQSLSDGDDEQGPETSPEDSELLPGMPPGGELSPGETRTEPGERAGAGPDGGSPGGVAVPERVDDAGSTPGDPRLEPTSTVLLANVASTQALFAGVVLAAAWYLSIPPSAFGATPVTPLDAGVGVGFGLVLWLANELSTTVADTAGAAYDETVRGLLAPGSTRGWVGLLVVVLPLIAFAEELLFRAALIGVPAAGFDVSPWPLAVVASLAFALGHGAQGRVGVVVTGFLGLALAGGYVLTGSLLVVVLAHYVINAMEFLLHERLGVGNIGELIRERGSGG